MRKIAAVVAAAVSVLHARSAWACSECFGDGSAGSIVGWLVLGGLVLFVVTRIFRAR